MWIEPTLPRAGYKPTSLPADPTNSADLPLLLISNDSGLSARRMSSSQRHWSDQYGNQEYYRWRSFTRHGRTTYLRPLGNFEAGFDSDGRYHQGLADMTLSLDLQLRSHLSDEDLRQHITQAWACFRCKHLLSQSKVVHRDALGGEGALPENEIFFAIDPPNTAAQAIADATTQLFFLRDHFETVDRDDFWLHCQNSARNIDPDRVLAKLFVLPPQAKEDGLLDFRLHLVCAHEVCDGVAMSLWVRSLLTFLNEPPRALREHLGTLLEPERLSTRLPQAQEALYPPIQGNAAQRRWFWAITRILRHVHKPLPAAFENPLRRHHPRPQSVSLPPTYAPVLDYSRPPSLNTFPCYATMPVKAARRLHQLCRDANTSVGAGVFALAALLMMEMYERREPAVPLSQRRPFLANFPLNPRAFFNRHVDPDSCMIGFSDGICLHFLPSHLDLDGRLKLLARQADRQLATYQKRSATTIVIDDTTLRHRGSRGADRILPMLYLYSLERRSAALPPHRRPPPPNPQGAYPVPPNASPPTCAVSSVGRKEAVVRPGLYDLDDDTRDVVADFRAMSSAVRPRVGEFLCGVGGELNTSLGMNASVDGNAIDPVLAAEWCRRFATVLEDEPEGMSAKL